MYHPRKHLPANRGLFITLAALFLATAATVAFCVYTLLSLRVFIQNGTQDMRTVVLLQNFMLDLRNAESSQRGYILASDNESLKSYERSAAIVPKDLQQLAADSSMKSGYQSQLTQLRTLTNTRMQQLEYGLGVVRVQGRDAALALHFERGSATTDQINSIASHIVQAEYDRIIPQQKNSDSNLGFSLIMAPLLAVVVLAICGFIVRFFQKAIENERAIEGSKNEFLSLASHQLRTPATNVKQYVHLVLDGYLGKITPEQRQALETASRNNDIEISIVNDLLDIAKVDLNQIMITPEPSNAGRLVRQVMKDFHGPAKKRGQVITYKEPRGLPKVLIDPTYFKSVIENLIDNASKYSPPHSPIKLFGEIENGRYVLRIIDRGVGIPRNQQHKLFKKFSRVSNALSDAVEGSGLGLYWVKRVIELHHGSITVESSPNTGTTFTVRLPIAPRLTKASPAPLSRARPV